jgi:hypothetical protein
VSTSTGTHIWWLRHFWQTSKPDMPGSITSSTTASYSRDITAS